MMNHDSNSPQRGLVLQYQSNFYTVVSQGASLQCVLKGMLKKEGTDVLVGDWVILDSIDTVNNTGRIVSIETRHAQLSRPKVANVDCVLIMASITSPDLDLMQLDRYITHVRLASLTPMICLTKWDLLTPNATDTLSVVQNIYEPLGIPVFATSIYDMTSVNHVVDNLKGTITVLAGLSGVGKSSFINAYSPTLDLKVGDVSHKAQRGQHTTRSAALFELTNKSYVVDTPGFSLLSFDDTLPESIEAVFSDFASWRQNCRFANCLHQGETGCAVEAHREAIACSRWDSYHTFLSEAKAHVEWLQTTSQKQEYGYKTLKTGKSDSMSVLKLKDKHRQASRRTQKQHIQLNSYDDAEEHLEKTLPDNE